MKWKEFESRYSKELYSRTKQLCEDIHSEQRGFAGFFCDYCYKREGWYCFPCDSIKKRYEKRWDKSLDKIIGKDD